MLEFLSHLTNFTLSQILEVLYLDLQWQVIYEPLAAVRTSEMIAMVEGILYQEV